MSEDIKRYILKLRSKYKVGEDYYIFDFVKPQNIVFKEGQYGVFMHVKKEIEGRRVRAFSIASSNNEDFFRVATKIIDEPSDFKKKMLELDTGDSMTFDGPMGSFVLNDEMDCVFIAGGIGITPIRGILAQLVDKHGSKKVELIYSEPREIYPFKKEFDKMTFVKKYYKSNIENTKETIDKVSFKCLNKAIYYIAGSPGFVGGVKEQLLNNGVKNNNIIFDRFNGY